MSLICARKYEDKIIVAADTRVCDSEGLIFSESEEKIKKIGNAIVGCCGDVDIMREFFAYIFQVPYVDIPRDTLKAHALITKFVNEIKMKGYDITNQCFLFAVDGKLIPMYYTTENGVFSYDNDYEFCALGVPKEYALALMDSGYPPLGAIQHAAKRYSCINSNVITHTIETK